MEQVWLNKCGKVDVSNNTDEYLYAVYMKQNVSIFPKYLYNTHYTTQLLKYLQCLCT